MSADDYKQSTLLDILNGYCDSAGYTWYIDGNGTVQVFPWELVHGWFAPKFWCKIRKNEDKIVRFTNMDFGKRSMLASGGGTNPITGGPQLLPYSVPALPGGAVGTLGVGGQDFAMQLTTPLANVTGAAVAPGSSGYVGAVGWWDGPPHSTGRLCGYTILQSLSAPINVPVNGQPPITWISFTAYVPVGVNGPAIGALAISGNPWVQAQTVLAGTDPSFFTTYDSGELPIRYAQRWIDNRHQSKAAMDARKYYIVSMKRALAGWRNLDVDTPMLLDNGLLQKYDYQSPGGGTGTNNLYRVHKITDTMGAEAPWKSQFHLGRFLI